MQKITTFLMFPEKCMEAVEFYTSVFENARIVETLRGPDGNPAGAIFEIDGQQFHCYNGGEHFQFSQAISLMVNVDTQAETDRLYEELSEGGEQLPCGWVTDKFGVSWQVTPRMLMKAITDPDAEKAKRATEAMLQMYKIDIAKIEAAMQNADQ